jgi:hypothetical protein
LLTAQLSLVKNRSWLVIILLSSSFVLSFTACKKINESTELGYDLIPPIDNVNTFDTSLAVITDNKLFNDTLGSEFSDDLAIGTITSDPEFGSTRADAYFDLRPFVYGSFPFLTRNPDSLTVDSVVLQLSYKGAFGDTNSQQKFTVYQIDENSTFSDTAIYPWDHPDFVINTIALGSKTFAFNELNDSVPVVRKGDTTKVANVLRIKLNNVIGENLISFDTAGFKSDSIFKTLFKGLAVKAEPGMGNGLGYFNASDAKTKMTIYYKAKINGVDSNSKTDLVHIFVQPSGPVIKTSPVNFRNGQANLIRRTNAGNYATYLANSTASDDKVYIQTMPGSYAAVQVPGLSSFPNAVVHRAELIIYKIPSALDNIFTPPARLFLDKINNAGDTAYVFQKDLYSNSGALQYDIFGGAVNSSGIYKFNITRHVQDLITRKEPNYTLRLNAPVKTELYFPASTTQKVSYMYNVLTQPANGRVVLAGGSFADPSQRMRLRIIYSKL